MTVKQYIQKHGWQYYGEHIILYGAISVQVGFINDEGNDDETEFSIEVGDCMNELDQLFSDFCKENGFSNDTVTYVTIVRTANSMDELIEMECR